MAGWWAELIHEPEPAHVSVVGGTPQVSITEHHFLKPDGAVVSVVGGRPSIVQTVRPDGANVSVVGGTPLVSIGQILQPAGAAVSVTPGTPKVTLLNQIQPAGASVSVTPGTPTVTVVTPPTFDAIGTGFVSTGGTGKTCTITPSAGSCGFVVIGADRAGSVTSVKWGATNMTLVATLSMPGGVSGNGFIAVYGITGIPGGSTTITVDATSGSTWEAFNAVAYKNSTIGTPTTASGTGSPASQSVIAPPRVAWFVAGASNVSLSTLTVGGGTSRGATGNGQVAVAVGDAASSATFTGTASNMSWWASVAVPLG